jgi:hypothetical protein
MRNLDFLKILKAPYEGRSFIDPHSGKVHVVSTTILEAYLARCYKRCFSWSHSSAG